MTTITRKIFSEIDTILNRADELEQQPQRKTISYDELMRRRGTPIDWDAIAKM